MKTRSRRYQRLDIAYCIVVSNWIYDQPDDGLEKKFETCSCSQGTLCE